jgi:hypothetical protein
MSALVNPPSSHDIHGIRPPAMMESTDVHGGVLLVE